MSRPAAPFRIDPSDYEVRENGCWIWTRSKPGGNGYAMVKLDGHEGLDC